jgi:hypothetical protein
MKRICLIDGSLRGKQASSLQFLNDIANRLPDAEYAKTTVTVQARPKAGYPPAVLEELAAADALIVVFPLYTYALPGALMRLFEDYYSYVGSGKEHRRGAKVYAIVNCGFPRPVIFDECIRVLKNFCRRLSLDWRFAVCISGGPVVVVTRRVPLLDLRLKRAFGRIAADLRNDRAAATADYFIRPVLPESILLAAKRRVEKQMGMR